MSDRSPLFQSILCAGCGFLGLYVIEAIVLTLLSDGFHSQSFPRGLGWVVIPVLGAIAGWRFGKNIGAEKAEVSSDGGQPIRPRRQGSRFGGGVSGKQDEMNRLVSIVIRSCSFVIVALIGFGSAGWIGIGLLTLFGFRSYDLRDGIDLLLITSSATFGLGLGYWTSKKFASVGYKSIRSICDLRDDQIDFLLRIWIAASGLWCVSIVAEQFLATDSWGRHKDFYYILVAYVFGGPLIFMGLGHLAAWVLKGKKA